MDSRFRGNDGGLQVFVIPALGGIQKLLAIYDLPQLIEHLPFGKTGKCIFLGFRSTTIYQLGAER